MDFSTVSADGAEKSKNQCFFDQKSTLTKIARKFEKSNPNPFQRRRNHEKIFINGREIAILVHFWEVLLVWGILVRRLSRKIDEKIKVFPTFLGEVPMNRVQTCTGVGPRHKGPVETVWERLVGVGAPCWADLGEFSAWDGLLGGEKNHQNPPKSAQ